MMKTNRYARARMSLRRGVVTGLSAAIFAMAGGSAFASHMPGHETGGGKGNNPPVIDDQQFNLDENEMAGAAIGQVTVTSEKKNNSFTFAITAGNGAGLFAIDPLTGDLTATAPLNHEQTDAHILTVEATDKFGRTGAGAVTVLVGDVNEFPMATDDSFSVSELSPVGTIVGIVQASDPDDSSVPIGILTYAINPTQTYGSLFVIDSNTGVLRTNETLDFDSVSSIPVSVEVTDGGGLSDTANITVDVLNAVIPADIAEIDGVNGFNIPGLLGRGGAGERVVIVGDISGDGFDDFALSDTGLDPDLSSVYVVFGSDTGFPADFDLTTLDGTNGFRFEGTQVNDSTGEAINGLGDFNHDGISDLLISSPLVANESFNSHGAVYVVFGGQQFSAIMTGADLNGTNGFSVVAEEGFESPGSILGLSAIGDVNGDGIDDFGAGNSNLTFPNISPQTGIMYAIFGRDVTGGGASFDPVLNLASLDSTEGMILYGAPGDGIGLIVNPIGDLNGDSFGDFVITSTTFLGLYVVFGNLDAGEPVPGEPLSFDFQSLDGTNGFAIPPVNESFLFGSASGGDLNGDGRADIVIGSPGEDINGLTNAGAGYVIFGTDSGFVWPASFDLLSLDGTNGFRILGETELADFGFPMDNRSDLDGDGFDDLIAAAAVITPQLPTGDGEPPPPSPPAFYYFIAGSDQPFPAEIDLSGLDPAVGSRMAVPMRTDRMGAGGDINGDGAGDFIVGNAGAVTANGDTGQATVIFGADF